MRTLIEPLVIVFAIVGLVALGLWIYRRGWGVPAKVVSLLVVVSFAGAVLGGPANGRWGADHGALTDLIATFGILLVGMWALRRYGAGWQPYAISAATLVLLMTMWLPRYFAGEFTLPTGGTSPTNGWVAPSSSQPVSPSRTHPRARRQAQPRQNVSPSGDVSFCESLSTRARLAAQQSGACPP